MLWRVLRWRCPRGIIDRADRRAVGTLVCAMDEALVCVAQPLQSFVVCWRSGRGTQASSFCISAFYIFHYEHAH